MAQHFVPNRPKARRKHFATKHEGYRQRTLVWTCVHCHAQHTDERPGFCAECEGRKFHYFQSRLEANRFASLFLQQGQGLIGDLVVHPEFPIYGSGPTGKPVLLFKYVADFGYIRVRDGVRVVEDAKPSMNARSHDSVFKLKAKCVERAYGVPITIYSTAR